MGTPALDTLIVVEIFVSDPSIMASTVLVLAVDNVGRPCFDWDGGAGRDGVVNASQGRLQYGCVYISYIVYAVRACHSDAFKSGPLVSLARDSDY